jgi:hypothetical protein
LFFRALIGKREPIPTGIKNPANSQEALETGYKNPSLATEIMPLKQGVTAEKIG